MSVRLLVSVRDDAEALAAAGAGADFIDLKEPADGALGAVAPERIAQVAGQLRARYAGLRLSATVGDLAAGERDEILARVRRVGSCGVDYVKVGIWPSPEAPALAGELLNALAASAVSVVPVLVVDEGLDMALVAQALRHRAFPALMVDTADKDRGSVLRRLPEPLLVAFVHAVRSSGLLAGVAGSLRIEDAPALRSLAPDFAGFRSAVTRGDRAGALDARLVRQLRRRLSPGTQPARRLTAAT